MANLCLFLFFELSTLAQRQEYNDFLEDRMKTIRNFRDAGGDVGVLDPKTDCLRGLEPFQTAYTNQDMHSKRQFHQNTIILEQMRQTRLGIRDPDRFRMLVSARSELALMKAQEQAAIDQHEIHNTVGRRGSLITNMMVRNNLKTVGSNNQSLTLSESIRALQEQNARKLMQIYQNSWNGQSRFPIRRDSLFGSNMGNEVGGPLITPTMRFPIRRDSLG